METYKITRELTPGTNLQFSIHRGSDYYPVILKGTDKVIVPLMVSEEQIPGVIKILDLINFYDFPLNHIRDIIAGCISNILKKP